MGNTNLFYNEDGFRFERRYLGFLQRLWVNWNYNSLIESTIKQTGAYINSKDLNGNEGTIAFFHLNKSEDKSSFYYFDIYSYLKQKYNVIFLIAYIACLCLLFFIGEKKQIKPAPIYYKCLIANLMLLVLYFLL